MNALLEIFLRDRDTYYNFRTEELRSVWPRYLLGCVFGVLAAVSLDDVPGEVLAALIALFSILIGFGFSSQFFLVDRKFEAGKSDVVELEILEEKINKLAKELFANIQYFNVVAITVVVLAIFNMVALNRETLAFLGLTNEAIECIWQWLGLGGNFLIASVSFEAMSSFIRIVVRTEYLFRKIQETK